MTFKVIMVSSLLGFLDQMKLMSLVSPEDEIICSAFIENIHLGILLMREQILRVGDWIVVDEKRNQLILGIEPLTAASTQLNEVVTYELRVSCSPEVMSQVQVRIPFEQVFLGVVLEGQDGVSEREMNI